MYGRFHLWRKPYSKDGVADETCCRQDISFTSQSHPDLYFSEKRHSGVLQACFCKTAWKMARVSVHCLERFADILAEALAEEMDLNRNAIPVFISCAAEVFRSSAALTSTKLQRLVEALASWIVTAIPLTADKGPEYTYLIGKGLLALGIFLHSQRSSRNSSAHPSLLSGLVLGLLSSDQTARRHRFLAPFHRMLHFHRYRRWHAERCWTKWCWHLTPP